MDTTPTKKTKHPQVKRLPFERTVLLLQGGGALGSYQAGVYQALAEADLQPDWVAGISIGAMNSALIAGNPPENRVERLREFWEAVSTPPFGVPLSQIGRNRGRCTFVASSIRRARWASCSSARRISSRPACRRPCSGRPTRRRSSAIYDVAPLKATLERWWISTASMQRHMRFSVGAVNVRTGNFTYFDTTTHRIGPAHVIASGSLPPGFPATEIDGEYYWDGGLVSNTPLQWVLDSRPRQDTLAFQVDLWSARGEMPRNLGEDRSAPKGNPVLQPHPGGDRSVQESAETPHRGRQSAQAASRRAARTIRR